MRRWDRPLHDFLLPYLRGAIGRVTGTEVIPYEVEHRSSRAEATWEKWAAS
jgi:hypothetical protein